MTPSRFTIALRVPCAALLAAATVARPAPAQHTWRTLEGAQPAARRHHAAAWDTARQRLVVFGGYSSVVLGDTWEWDGASWARREPATVPQPRYLTAMAYDGVRRRVVMFGGTYFRSPTEGTWEWDGADWTEVTTAHAPAPRTMHSLTWDPIRQRIVLFGGTERGGTNSELDDTWEYDGVDWTRRTPATSPTARSRHGATFDATRGRLVIYAGSRGGPHDDVWEWDGTTWTDVTPATTPPPRDAPLAFDPLRGRTVLYGGSPGLQDTWEWDGRVWRQVATPATAGPRTSHALVFDPVRGEVLAVGGATAQLGLDTSAIAAYDGTTWRSRTSAPLFRIDAPVAWHPSSAQTVTFGGPAGPFALSDETHVFAGGRWQHAAVPVKPPQRSDHLVVTDRARDRVLLFGGAAGPTALGDTWTWDGRGWVPRSPAVSPSPRVDPTGCCDERRDRVVLFGGAPPGFSLPFDDTWEWDGTDWRRVTTATSPGPHTRAAMAYDAVRGVAVMFGGGVAGGGLIMTDETWEYDGADWRLASPTHRPSARIDHSMIWDPVRQRIVLFGGAPSGGGAETWEYDGADWVQVATDHPASGKLVFDERMARTLGMIDGFESWELSSEAPPVIESFGVSCGGARGPLELRAETGAYPVIGRTTSVAAARARPSWPVFLMLGVSRTIAHGQPLPFDLTPAGMPGCALLQSGEDVTYALADAGETARFVIGIANDPALLGAEVYLQAFVPDATANVFGWAASGGLTLRVGT